MKTDIEIAGEARMKNILEIAKDANIDTSYIEQYGNYKAKIDLSLLQKETNTNSKLILVTAISPTPAGEGKTTTTIGLADGLRKINKNVIVALREPSLGPVFGIKGGAAGGDGCLWPGPPVHRRGAAVRPHPPGHGRVAGGAGQALYLFSPAVSGRHDFRPAGAAADCRDHPGKGAAKAGQRGAPRPGGGNRALGRAGGRPV